MVAAKELALVPCAAPPLQISARGRIDGGREVRMQPHFAAGTLARAGADWNLSPWVEGEVNFDSRYVTGIS